MKSKEVKQTKKETVKEVITPEERNSLVESLDVLKVILSGYYLSGTEDNTHYSPILNQEEAKIVRGKMIELVKQL